MDWPGTAKFASRCLVYTLFDSPELSIATVPELLMAVTAIGSRTFAYVPTLGILALAYWALVEGTAWLGRRVEARVGRFMVRPA